VESANFASFHDMHPSGKEHLPKENKPGRRRRAPNMRFACGFVHPDALYFVTPAMMCGKLKQNSELCSFLDAFKR